MHTYAAHTQIEKTKQEVSNAFQSHGLKITTEAIKKTVNFLDVTLDLTNGAMRAKSIETLSFQRVFWCILFNYCRLAQKNYPPSAKQCWISYFTNDGICSGTTLN